MNKKILVSFLVVLNLVGFAQAPGGYISNLKSWYKSNNGLSVTGVDVNAWNNSVGGFPNLSNKIGTPTVKTSGLNYNPTVVFQGNEALFTNTVAGTNYINNNNNTVFVVITKAQDSPIGSGVVAKWESNLNPTTNRITVETNKLADNFIRFDFPNNTTSVLNLQSVNNKPFLFTFNNNGNFDSLFVSGLSESRLATTLSANSAENGLFSIGANSNGAYSYIGEVAEVIYYGELLSAANRLKVETYLALKYGFTLGSNSRPVNYISSNNNIIWTGSTTYQNNIAGLARDDNSGQNQRQGYSQSDSTLKIGRGTIAGSSVLNPNALINDNSFMIWGDNGQNMNFGAAGSAIFTNGALGARSNKVWRLQETATVGSVKLAFPASIGTSGKYLVVSNDETFNSTDTYIALTPEVVNGVPSLTANYDFNNGVQYFAVADFGMNINGETGVTTEESFLAIPDLTSNDLYISVLRKNWYDLDPLTAGLQTSFSNAAGSWSFSTTTGNLIYVAAPGFTGVALINYQVCDSLNTSICDTALVKITVTPVSNAPGGIKSGLKAWYKSDLNVTTSGANVSSWNNSVANGVNLTSVVNTPILKQRGINYNPAIDFDGTDYFEQINQPGYNFLRNGNNSVFVVVSNTSGTQSGIITKWEDSGITSRFAIEATYAAPNFKLRTDYPNSLLGSMIVGTSNIEGRAIIGSSHTSSTIDSLYTSGILDGTTTIITQAFGNHLNGQFNVGGQGSGFRYIGQIAEIIYFGSRLGNSGRQRVQTYLAIKYGISLGSNAVPINYQASNGSTIWSGSTTYQNNIAGIGRDDASALNQKQSTSQSDSTVKIGLTTIASNNSSNVNSFAANLSFLTWGDNNAALTFGVNGTAVHSNGGIGRSLLRIWRTLETNTVGNVKVAFPTSIGTISGKCLVVSSDETFNASDTYIPLVAEVVNGIASYTASYNFVGTQFFTVADFPISINGETSTCNESSFKMIPDISTNDTYPTLLKSWYDLDPVTVGIQSTFTNAAGTWLYNKSTGNLLFTATTGFTGLAQLQYRVCDSVNTSTCDTALVRITVLPVSLAPGGIKKGLSAWYRADANVSTSGSTVTAWNNSVTNGINATTIGSDPDLLPTGLNYNPAINFDGNDNIFTNVVGGFNFLMPSFNSAYVVFNAASTPSGGSGVVSKWESSSLNRSSFEILPSGSNLNLVYQFPRSTVSALSSNNYSFGAFLNLGKSSTSLDSLYSNGVLEATASVGGNVLAYENSGRLVIGAHSGGGFNYIGNIAEIIYFGANHSLVEKNRIESYLALKYGITLGTPLIPSNYVSSIGTVIWAGNSTYQNNIAGIGRDDLSGLNQKQSFNQSNTLLKIGLGTIAASNAANTNTFASNNIFNVWGDNGGGTLFDVNITAPNSITGQRMSRIWTMRESGGTVPSLKVSIPAASGPANRGYLIVSSDAVFDATDTYVPMINETINSINSWSCTYDFTNGQFFTFADFDIQINGETGTTFQETPIVVSNLRANDRNLEGNLTNAMYDLNTSLAGIQTTFTNASGVWTFNTTSGNLTFNPATGFSGTAQLVYEVCEGATPALCDTALVKIMVNPVTDAPGGVTGNLTFWLKANDTPNLTITSNKISQWNSDFPDGLVFTQATGLNQPDYVANSINFNPAAVCSTGYFMQGNRVVYNSTSKMTLFNVSATSTDLSIFTQIVNPTSSNPSFTPGGQFGYSNAQIINALAPTGLPIIAAASRDSTNATTFPAVTYRNGSQINSTNLLAPVATTISGTQILGRNQGASSGYSLGSVSELIGYNKVLSAAERQRVFSYLAIKYGITLNVDYLASDGTLLWDIGGSGGFDNNIQGIGRDDKSSLYQKQSKSVNVAGLVTMGIKTISTDNISNTSIMNDKAFVIFGDNGQGIAYNNGFNGPSGVQGDRMLRIWKVSEVGTVDTVKVAIPIANAGIGSTYLVVSNDGTFDSGDFYILMKSENIGGQLYMTTKFNFTNGQIFTFADFGQVVNGESGTTNEDTPVVISNLKANDKFFDNTVTFANYDLDPNTAGIQTTFSSNGTWTLNTSNGNLTYNPALNFNGLATLIYRACSNEAPPTCDTAMVKITVNAVNDPPIANKDVLSGTEDNAVSVNITTNDTDIDGLIDATTVDLDVVTAGIQKTFTIIGQGTFNVDNAGLLTFTPVSGYNGTVNNLIYRVCDTGTPLPSQCDTSIVAVTISAVNDPPIANKDVLSGTEDNAVSVNITTNDTDSDGLIDATTIDLDVVTAGIQKTFTIVGQGTFTVDNAGLLTFTPVSNFNGTVNNLIYRVCDTGTPLPSQCDTSIVAVTISAVNDPPIANKDVLSGTEDNVASLNITTNDTDVDGTIDFLTIDLDNVSPGVQNSFNIIGQGTFNVDNAGLLTFTPVSNFNGTVNNLVYRVCDTGTPLPSQCDTSIVAVTISAVNDPPIANKDVLSGTEDNAVSVNITTNDTDSDGLIDATTVDLDISTVGIQKTFTIVGQGTFTVDNAGLLTFTPVSNFNGTVNNLIYRVCDTGTPLPSQCDTSIVAVTISAVNDPPIANKDVLSGTENNTISANITTNDTDSDGLIDATTFDLDVVTAGIQKTFTIVGQGTFTVDNAGLLTFTPVSNFNGTVNNLIYRVCDTGTPLPSQCDTSIVAVTISAVNDPPIANKDVLSGTEDNAVSVNITTNDTDSDGLIDATTVDLDVVTAGIQKTFTIVGQGTFTVDNAGLLTFTPVSNFNGTVNNLIYRVCDTGTPLPSQCDTSIVAVTISAVNDPPIANKDVLSGTEDNVASLNITTNDTDVDGTIDFLTIDLDNVSPGVQNSFNIIGQGTFNVDNAGLLTFTPVSGYNGTVNNLIYRVCDTGTPLPSQCDTSIVAVTISAVNDPLIANKDVLSGTEDNAVSVNITTNDTDSDGLIDATTVDLDVVTAGIQKTFTIVGQGTFTVDNAGLLTFTPVSDYNGTVNDLIYRVCDTGTPLPSQCDTSIVTVTISAVNDPPIANKDVLSGTENNTVSANITTNDTDIDGLIDATTVDLDVVTAGIQKIFTIAGQGTFNVDNAGLLTFTPISDYNGTVNDLIYRVCDTGTPLPSQCDTSIVAVTISAVNDSPIANKDVLSGTEDNAVSVNITTNDTDSDGLIDATTIDLDINTIGIQKTFTIVGQGTFTVDNAGLLTFNPVSDYNGTVNDLIYRVCDTGTPLPSQCDTSIVAVTISAVNDPPIANKDVLSGTEDNAVSVNITTNDTDSDGLIDATTIDLDNVSPGVQNSFTIVGQGTFTVDNAGLLTFTPVFGYNGTVNDLIYRVCDTGTPLPSQCDTSIVAVTISAVNDPPIANKDVLSGTEDNAVSVNITTNDTDSDGLIDATTVDLDVVTAGIQKTFTIVGQGAFTVDNAGLLTFNPVSDYNGTVNDLIYRVCDTGTPLPSQCDTSIVAVTISAVNDPPIANKDVLSGTENNTVSANITTNDTDIDGLIDATTVDLDVVTAGIQKTFTIVGQGTFTVDNAGLLTFTPVSNFNGTVNNLIYRVCDTGTPLPSQCDTSIVAVTISAVNDPPIANKDVLSGTEDNAVSVNITTNDTDSDGLIDATTIDLDVVTAGIQKTFTIVGQGTFTVDNAGLLTFTPVSDYNGTVNDLIYRVCDTGTPLPSQCDTSIVTVTISAVNDPPIANKDVLSGTEDNAVSVSITTNDTDSDGLIDAPTIDLDINTIGIQKTFTIVGQGTFTVDNAGLLTFTPISDYNGTVNDLIYRVCDTGTPLPSQCDTSIVAVTISAVNDPPVANGDNATTNQNVEVTSNVILNDNDLKDQGTINNTSLDLDPNAVGIQSTFTIVGEGVYNSDVSGNISFTPVTSFFGISKLVYQVCDNGIPLPSLCDTSVLTITVIPVVLDINPIANKDTIIGLEDQVVGFDLLLNDTDPQGKATININSVDLDFTLGGVQDSLVIFNKGKIKISNGVLTFSPVLNYNGIIDSIYYTITDVNGNISDTALIVIVTQPVNDSPIVKNESITIKEDSVLAVSILDSQDFDIEGTSLGALTVPIQSPKHGNVVIQGSGLISYTPGANYNGNDTIVVSLCDNGLPLPRACALDTIVIQITPINDPPLAIKHVYSLVQGQTFADNLLLGRVDIELTPLVFNTTAILAPKNGNLSVSSDGAISYTMLLNANFVSDTAIIELCDSGSPLPALCVRDTIIFNPISIKNFLNAFDDIDTTYGAAAKLINLLGNDIYPAGVTISILGTFNNGTNVVKDSILTYTPNKNYLGVDSISYVICSNTLNACDTALVVISTLPDNIFIPDGFSPNGDGKNETFEIFIFKFYDQIQLEVVNRWGNLVYSDNNYKNDWNGSSNTGISLGDRLPDGTYFCKITMTNSSSGSSKSIVKYITIARGK